MKYDNKRNKYLVGNSYSVNGNLVNIFNTVGIYSYSYLKEHNQNLH